MEAACDGYLETMKDISDEGNKAAESSKTWQSAASEAIQSVQSQIDNFAAAYDEAFEAAQKSIQNTVGLTTELSNETEITTGKLTETWENQIEWINKYSENLQKAQQYGITELSDDDIYLGEGNVIRRSPGSISIRSSANSTTSTRRTQRRWSISSTRISTVYKPPKALSPRQ